MRQRPLFSQQLGIDRQRGERIFSDESEIAVDGADHSEHARFLHPMQLAPKFCLGENMPKLELRFQFLRRRKQRELTIFRAERMRRQRVKGKLDAATFHQLPEKFALGRVPAAQFLQIETALPSRFVIDNPKIIVTEL